MQVMEDIKNRGLSGLSSVGNNTSRSFKLLQKITDDALDGNHCDNFFIMFVVLVYIFLLLLLLKLLLSLLLLLML